MAASGRGRRRRVVPDACILTRDEEPDVATEEAILASILSSNLAGLAKQVRVYIESSSFSEKSSEIDLHSRAKKLVPFICRFIKQCGLELRHPPTDADTAAQNRGNELFSAMELALDALESCRRWIASSPFEIELQRSSFVRKLVAWKRFREASVQCKKMLQSLNSFLGSDQKQVGKLVVLPPRSSQETIADLPVLFGGVVRDLINCSVEGGIRDTESLQELARLPAQVEPWFSLMNSEEQMKHRDNLFRLLYKMSTILALDPSCHPKIVQEFCIVSLRCAVRASQIHQCSVVARKVCSSLASRKTALDLCAALLTNIGTQKELQGVCHSADMSDFVGFYATMCQQAGRYDHGWQYIREFMRSDEMVKNNNLSAICGIYAVGLRICSESCFSNIDYSEPAKLLQLSANRLACAINQDAGRDAIFKALDYLRDNAANYIEFEWDLFLKGGQERGRLMAGLIKLFQLHTTGLRRDTIISGDKEVIKKSRIVIKVAFSALRLSIASNHMIEVLVTENLCLRICAYYWRVNIWIHWIFSMIQESALVIRQIMKELPAEDFDWLKHTVYNTGVKVFNTNQYHLARKPLELAHDAVWSRVHSLISSSLDAQPVSEAFSEACAKTSAFADCLARSNNVPCAMDVLRDAFVCWVRVSSSGFNLQGPQSLLRLWHKVTLQSSLEIRCLYGVLCDVQPRLPAASFGLLLEELLLSVEHPEHSEANMTEAITKFLIDQIYDSQSFPVERCKFLIERSRIARSQGADNLHISITLLSEALQLTNKALGKGDVDEQQRIKLGYQLAIAYCLRAQCNQEADPCSEDYIEDIASSTKLWTDIMGSFKRVFSSTHCKEALRLLRSTADLLALKGMSKMQDKVFMIMQELAMHSENPTSQWADTRLGHILCHVTASQGFPLMLRHKFGDKADEVMHKFDNELPDSLSNARRALAYSDFSRKYSGDLSQEYSAELDELIDLARSSPSSDRDRVVLSGVKFYLAEVYLQKGDLETAIKYAVDTLECRLRHLNVSFQIFKEDDRSKKEVRSNYEAYATRATMVWPSFFTSNLLHSRSQWHILGDYVESLMQVGVLYERLGNSDEAERNFHEGLLLAQAQNMPLACMLFASCLGEVHRKQHMWENAQEDFNEARQHMEKLSMNENICTECIGMAKSHIELRIGDFVRHSSNVKENTESLEAAIRHYDYALEVLRGFPFMKKSFNKLPFCIEEASFCKWILYRWEYHGRKLAAKLYIQQGKCRFQMGHIGKAEECYMQAKQLLCVESGPDKQSMFPLDEAVLLYHWSLLHLWKSDTENISSLPCISWLQRTFTLSITASLLFKKVSQLLSLLHIFDFEKYSKELAAFFHQASVGSMSRQQHLLILESKAKQEQVNVQHLREMTQALRISREGCHNLKTEYKSLIEGLPPATVCCMSLVEQDFTFFVEKSLKQKNQTAWLLVSRFGDGEVVVTVLPIYSTDQPPEVPESCGRLLRHRALLESDGLVRSIMAELASILYESHESTSCTMGNAAEWWKWRVSLDSRLSSFLKNVEKTWFGAWKCILLGEPTEKKLSEGFRKQAKDLCRIFKSNSFLGQIKLSKNPDEALIKLILQGISLLQTEQLENLVACVLGFKPGEQADEHTVLVKKAREAFLSSFCAVMSGEDSNAGPKTRSSSRKESNILTKPVESFPPLEREPVELVLDGRLQELPWENLPIMRKFEAYRMPSVGSIRASFIRHKYSLSSLETCCEGLGRLQLNSRSKCNNGKNVVMRRLAVNPHNAFYLLNPGGDLLTTQSAFEDWFRRQKGWEGKAGQRPTIDEYKAGLLKHELFVYLGHGSGDQYFPERSLRKLENCAASLLMGCSSGRFRARGDYEPVGVPLSYLMAGCPLAVANLWDVTDADIDRFSRTLLRAWLEGETKVDSALSKPAPKRGRKKADADESSSKSEEWEEICIGPSIQAGRLACRLGYLIGASPVCYGVPTVIRRSKSSL